MTQQKIKASLSDYCERRETVNRLREQLPEINRRTAHLETIMLVEVGATSSMLATLHGAKEALSRLSTQVSQEEQKLMDIYRSFSEGDKDEIKEWKGSLSA